MVACGPVRIVRTGLLICAAGCASTRRRAAAGAAPAGGLTLPAGEGIRLIARAAPGAAALAGAGIRAPLPASHVHGCHHGTAIIEGNDDPVYSRLPALGAEVEDVLPVVPEPARLLWRS